MDWVGGSCGQKVAEEGVAEGTEQQLLGEGHISMRDDQKWQSGLAQAREGDWGVLDVCSDCGGDGAGASSLCRVWLAGWGHEWGLTGGLGRGRNESGWPP